MKLSATLVAAALLASAAFAGGAEAATAAAGAKVFNKCKTCHVLKGDENKLGPTLQCIFGRKGGSIKGFAYSENLLQLKLTWDPATLKSYIAKPKAVIPKGKMAFAGINKPEQIDDLLAYLAVETKTPACPK